MPNWYAQVVTSQDIQDGTIRSEDLADYLQENIASLILKQDHIAEHQFARSYANIFVEEVDISIADTGNIDTYVQVVAFAQNAKSYGAIPDYTQDHITITESGCYLILFSYSFSSNNANETFRIAVHTNNGTRELENVHVHRKVGGANDLGSASGVGIAFLSRNETVELWVNCSSAANKEIATHDASLSVLRIR